jgi:hypothetical protein
LSGVDNEYDTANVLGVCKLGGGIVPELAVTRRVEEEEVARALEGWVAW